MTYSDFTLDTVRKAFGLTIDRRQLFAAVAAIEPPRWLTELLVRSMPLALGSEKARSEFIIAPVLLAGRELSQEGFAIYSGQRLDSDPSHGLTGECDFILTKTPLLPIIQSPIVTIVEAKKNDIETGLGQCAAQMMGARLFNQKEKSMLQTIFGCTTTGEVWQFLKLEREMVAVDSERYYIDRVDNILGVFQAILASYPP